MSGLHIYTKIFPFFINNFENQDPNIEHPLDLSSDKLSAYIANHLPVLSIQQIHHICRTQEKNILQKVIHSKPYDLYEQIAKVCPDEKDIKVITSEEIAMRLHQYSSKLVLKQRMTCESQDQSEKQAESVQERYGEAIFFDEQFQIRMMNQGHSTTKNQQLRDIFEEFDNHQCWGTGEEFYSLN